MTAYAHLADREIPRASAFFRGQKRSMAIGPGCPSHSKFEI